jgi:aspartyl-tRNA(Asn)/glutamyl-tRNA(Gln) amidotransferase subunit C
MTITKETVEHVAKLARLELTPDEVTRYTEDLGKILSLVEQLNELDLSQVDVALQVDEALLRNAPHEEDGFFRVPKILSDSAAE